MIKSKQKEKPETAGATAESGTKENINNVIITPPDENVKMAGQAVEKLKNGAKKAKKLSQKANAVKDEVVRVLTDFCRQNSEFAQAIVQSDRTVADCLEDTVKGAGSCISDLEVYRRAVAFWFAGATVHFTMTIDLGDEGFSNAPEPAAEAPREDIKTAKSGLSLSLDELLGM